MDKKKEAFEKRLNEKVPLIIYPKGLQKKKLVQIIAYGFLYPKGLYWFNSQWNGIFTHQPWTNGVYVPPYQPKYSYKTGYLLNPRPPKINRDYYTETGDFTHGYLSPAYEEGDLKGYKRYWKFGDAVIFQIKRGAMSNGVNLFTQAVRCRKQTIKYKDDKYRSLKRAKAIADRRMENRVVDSEKHIKGFFDIKKEDSKEVYEFESGKI